MAGHLHQLTNRAASGSAFNLRGFRCAIEEYGHSALQLLLTEQDSNSKKPSRGLRTHSEQSIPCGNHSVRPHRQPINSMASYQPNFHSANKMLVR